MRKSSETIPWASQDSALRSNGTLLPLPARYLLAPPWNSLGLGNMDSSTNFHLGSWITIRSPLAAPPPFARDAIELLRVGLGLFPLPFGASTKLLGSSIDRPTEPE